MAQRIPVFIISYNRPGSVLNLCRALKFQGAYTAGIDAFLVQDGYRAADGSGPSQACFNWQLCQGAFLSEFPNGTVLATDSSRNLGIPATMLRAYNAAFTERGLPHAYFFEDDLIPGPRYLEALETMREGPDTSRMATWSAYGHTGPERRDPRPYAAASELWAYGMFRGAWREINQWMTPFYAEWAKDPYIARNQEAVFSLYLGCTVASLSCAHDAAFAAAAAALGLARVNTTLNFGVYVGAHGTSTTPDKYAEMHYGNMRLAPDDAIIPQIPAMRIEEIAEQQATYHRMLRRDFLRSHLTQLQRSKESRP